MCPAAHYDAYAALRTDFVAARYFFVPSVTGRVLRTLEGTKKKRSSTLVSLADNSKCHTIPLGAKLITMTDQDDLSKLAKDFVDLWQEHLTQQASDPALAGGSESA